MSSNDKRGDLAAYCERATSALYLDDRTKKPLSCQQAFVAACELDPRAAEYWKSVVTDVREQELLSLPPKVPERVMSTNAKILPFK